MRGKRLTWSVQANERDKVSALQQKDTRTRRRCGGVHLSEEQLQADNPH